MPVLLALSVLAFVALLWATISIAGFVRRARRRRRQRKANAAKLRSGGLVSDTLEPKPTSSAPSRETAFAAPAVAPQDSAKPFPEAGASPDCAPPPVPDGQVPPPPRLRNFPTRLGKHTMTLAASDDLRPAWNPFRRDFGDLSDPTPRRRATGTNARTKDHL